MPGRALHVAIVPCTSSHRVPPLSGEFTIRLTTPRKRGVPVLLDSIGITVTREWLQFTTTCCQHARLRAPPGWLLAGDGIDSLRAGRDLVARRSSASISVGARVGPVERVAPYESPHLSAISSLGTFVRLPRRARIGLSCSVPKPSQVPTRAL